MAGELVPTPQSTDLAEGSAPLPAPGAYAPVPMEPEEEGLDFGRIRAALQRYRWLILAVTLVGTALAIFATRFIEPIYTANATIWIQPDQQRAGGPAPIRADELLQRSFAWVELLRTPVVLDSAALKAQLYLEPGNAKDSLLFRGFGLLDRFYPGTYVLALGKDGRSYELKMKGGGLPAETGTPGDSLGRPFGFAWVPPAAVLGRDREVEFTVRHPRDAANQLREELITQMAEDGNFLQIALRGSNPPRLARTVNAITDQFVRIAADLKTRKIVNLTDILSQQVEYAQRNLQERESALEGYRARTITLPSEGTSMAAGLAVTQDPVITNYFRQKLDADGLKRDREALSAVLARAQAGNFSVDAFQTVPAVSAAPELTLALQQVTNAEAELRALKFRYTDEHKPVQDMQARLDQLKGEIVPRYGQALVQQLATQERTLRGEIASASREIQSIPTRTITEQQLTRDAVSAERLFLTLQASYEEAKLAAASAQPDVQVLSEAVTPTQPSQNEAPRLILMGFLASLGLAGALAILLDRLDRRLRYPEQVTGRLGLGILGAVPQINKVKVSDRDAEEAGQVIEAFRTIRLNLAHSYGAAGPILLTVTSPSPGDGKSLISSNLALSFAEAGYTTLLVDGDTRRGELHRMFNTTRRPGLIDVLTGDAELEHILHPTSHHGLTVLPCGSRRHHGPELLGSPAMRELMGTLKGRYQVVIVDSPPLSAGIDPFVLSTATGHMLLVLRAGETDRQLAEEKLKLVDRLPIRILGAVLNSISADGSYRYYRYVYGYATEDEGSQQQLSAPSGVA